MFHLFNYGLFLAAFQHIALYKTLVFGFPFFQNIFSWHI